MLTELRAGWGPRALIFKGAGWDYQILLPKKPQPYFLLSRAFLFSIESGLKMGCSHPRHVGVAVEAEANQIAAA